MVNAEYVKYSLSLVEKDLYDKLGIKLDVEVIPLDAFVPKTLLEFNSGSSPWDLIMFGPSNMPDYGRHFEPLEPWTQKLKLDFQLDDIADVYKKLMLRHNGKLVSMPYDGDVHIMFWNKVAFERPDNKKKFKAKYKYDLQPPKTWKQWDDAAEFFHGWGWDGTDNKLFGAGASYKPSGSGYSYHWWRSRFFSYGGQYFDADMKPLINSAARVRALEEMVGRCRTTRRACSSSSPRSPRPCWSRARSRCSIRGPAPASAWATPRESVIVGKAGFGLVPGAEIDGKIIHRPAITPGRAMAVSKYSKKIEPTMKVLEFISLPDQSLKIVMDPKTIMDPWRVTHFRSEKFRKAVPRRARVSGRDREDLPAGGARPGHSRRRRVPAQALVRDHRGAGQAQAGQGGARFGRAEWDKITERRGRDKQKAAWGEKLAEMKAIGIEYHPDWAAKAK